MSVIIRLQNLPWSANALDIRQFFRGLSIPEGGVHIVGGELGDAFIAFSTDEDARQAFQLSNGKIKEVQIKLLLSSRTEMQKVIEAARNAQTPFLQSVTAAAPAIVPPVVAVQPNNADTKKEERDSKSKDESKSKRERSRRRSRSRSKSRDRKDRSRDRRDRRRRDRSRSRDRRDRRRDRRDRSRSRDRTRSKERETRRNRDDKRDSRGSSRSGDRTVIDLTEPAKVNSVVWEQTPVVPAAANVKPQGLLGNFPGPASSFEEARRSLGLIANLQNTITPPNDISNTFQRNEINNPVPARDTSNWQRNNRFPERNTPQLDTTPLNLSGQFRGNVPLRPLLGQNLNTNSPVLDVRQNFIQNQPLRMPYSDNAVSLNRPFLTRPGTLMPEQFRQDRNNQFSIKPERIDDSFRRDNRNTQFRPECCVQLRPYFGGYGEVRKFFHGLFINNTGVKIVNDHTGKRTGLVYIRFVRPDGKEQALTRSGMILRGVPVEVSHLADEEFEKYGGEEHATNDESQDSSKNASGSPVLSKFSCVMVENIPEFAKDNNIYSMFSDYAINCVHMTIDEHYNLIAYVQFDKEEDAMEATAKNAFAVGGKPVSLRPITNESFTNAQKQAMNGENLTEYSQNEPAPEIPTTAPPQLITDVALLTGMPHKTTDRDVIDFFSDIGLVPTRIHMLLGKFGPSGECYCEFNSPEDATAALDKNGMPLGSGTVHVELYVRREMERNLGLPPSMPMHQAPGPRFPNRFGPRGPALMGPRPPPNMMRRRPPAPGMRFDAPVDPMGPPGCMVTMENVPFKAGVNEILDFFETFELSNHNIFRRFNENGAPTGDARVTFPTPIEARRAVEECNKGKIRDRTVYLRIL